MDTGAHLNLESHSFHLEQCDRDLKRGRTLNIVSAVLTVAALVAIAMAVADLWPPRVLDSQSITAD